MNQKSKFLFNRHFAMFFLLAYAIGITSCMSSKSDGFEERLAELEQKIEEVSVVLKDAEGLAKSDGNINVTIAGLFSDYIRWELDHPEIMKDALSRNDLWPGQEKLSQEQQDERYKDHINRELTDVMSLLEESLTDFDKKAAIPEIQPIDWSKMAFKNGNFYVDERIVFPGGFNILDRALVNKKKHPEWTDAMEKESKSFLPDMRDMGVGIMGMTIPVFMLVDGNDSLSNAVIHQKLEEIRAYEKLGVRADIQLKWAGDNDLLEKLHPGITEHSSNGVPVDLDHPGTRELIEQAMARFVPIIKEYPTVVSWDMANEPFFDMKGWTKYGMRSFHQWLQNRHKTISALNKAWETNYEAFDQIPKPKNNPTQPEYKPGERTAPPKNKPSEEYSPGQWYDLVSFHNYRVSSFFGFVADEIRKHDPDAIIHMKGQDNNSLGPKPFAVTDGIDREMLTPAIDLHGVDTRPLPITEPRMAVIIDPDAENAALNYDESLYSFHWLGQSFLYDYLTSLESNRPIIDMEYHAFSINPIRVPDIGAGHASASLWLAHLHGMVANKVWYWNQRYGPNPFPSEEFKSWLYASISTQPIVAAEYFQTMNRLNKFSEEINALAKPVTRPIRIFVSKPSYIQNQKHIECLHRAYEASCFHGLPVGFVTEKMLVNDGVPEGSELIIIPDAQFVNSDALEILHKAKSKGVQLVRVGKQSITNDDYGFPYSDESVAFLNDIPVLNYASAPELDMQFGNLIKPLRNKQPVYVKTLDKQNAFGVMNRYATVDGCDVLLLVNVNADPVDVQLLDAQGNSLNGFDMLNHEAVKGEKINLAVKGVRLIVLE